MDRLAAAVQPLCGSGKGLAEMLALVHLAGVLEFSARRYEGSSRKMELDMKPNGIKISEPQFLSGWKDIATYLDKGVRTVQRYEREFGLPVRRLAGKPRGSVVATKAELDAWVSASPIRNALLLLPRPVGIPVGLIETMKQSMIRMGRLREQMSGLRTDLIATVQLVTSSISNIEREMRRNFDFEPDLSSMPMPGVALERMKNVVTIRDGKRRVS